MPETVANDLSHTSHRNFSLLNVGMTFEIMRDPGKGLSMFHPQKSCPSLFPPVPPSPWCMKSNFFPPVPPLSPLLLLLVIADHDIGKKPGSSQCFAMASNVKSPAQAGEEVRGYTRLQRETPNNCFFRLSEGPWGLGWPGWGLHGGLAGQGRSEDALTQKTNRQNPTM